MRRWALGVAAGLGAALLAAGCGTGGPAKGSPDVANGQKLFTGAGTCSACHTLAAAGSSGTIGPNLDDAFRADRQQGFDQGNIENVILDQIRLGSGAVTGGSPMPANLVKGQDAVDVAAYVASVAGTGAATSAAPARERRQGDLQGGLLELPHAQRGRGDRHRQVRTSTSSSRSRRRSSAR